MREEGRGGARRGAEARRCGGARPFDATAAREAEDGALACAAARAIAWETRRSWRLEDEPEPLPVPPLHLVTGWSKASGKAPHHPEVAMFGGWRIADMKRKIG